jgi:branched-chain amino acid transport system permease protein
MIASVTSPTKDNWVGSLVVPLGLLAIAIFAGVAWIDDMRTTLGTVGGVVAVMVAVALIVAWQWAKAMENGPVTRLLIVIGPAAAILIVQELVYPVDKGVYLFGMTLGLLSSLVALGMALIYRANRILNFAQGDLGLVPTVLAIDLCLYAHTPFFVGMFLGLAASLVLGLAVEFFIIRRFSDAPRLILTVATIGLASLLSLSSLIIPAIWSQSPVNTGLPEVFDFSFFVSPITFHFSTILALMVAPACIAGVAIFLRYTAPGMAVRASAERADRASLLGVPVKRLGTVVWMIATALSFLAVFVKANVVGPQLVTNGGIGTASFSALLAALTALMLGRLTNLPSVAISAVALGILEQAVIWHNGNTPLIVYPVYGIVVLIALVVRKTGQTRAEQDTSASWQSIDEVRPIPKELKKVTEVRAAKWGGLVLLLIVLIKLPSFGFMDGGLVIKASAVLIFGMVGISIIMLTGWAGQVSLGQMAFVGFGGAAGAYATHNWHVDLLIAMPFAGLIGAAVAVVVGLPALRVKGLFLAVTTLAFAVTTSSYLLDSTKFGWVPSNRVHIDRPPLFGHIDLESQQTNMYFLCLAALALSIIAVLGLRRSRTGRALMALRENEKGAQSYGINIVRAKLMAFALSGFLAALAGCLLTHVNQIFSPVDFGAQQSFVVFTATVVGGLGSITGALIGAVFFKGGTWFLQGNWQLLPSAVGVLVVLLVYPAGLSGLFFRVRDGWLRSVARRFGIVAPSLLADTKEPEEPIEHADEAAEEVDERAHAEPAQPGDWPVETGVGAGPPPSTGSPPLGAEPVLRADISATERPLGGGS